MVESEEPRETSADRIQAFAAGLRAVRRGLSYLEMERKTGCSHEKLQAAAAGKEFPDWKTVECYVIACGDDIDKWRAEWQAVSIELGDGVVADDDTVLAPERGTAVPPLAGTAGDGKRRVRRPRPVALMVGAVVVVGTVAAVVLVLGDNRTPGARGDRSPTGSVPPSGESSSPTAVPSSGTTNPRDEPRVPPGTTTGSAQVDPGPRLTTTASTAPEKPGETDREDPARQDDVQEQRVVELVQEPGYNWVDIEYWRHDATTPGELQINTQEVFTNLGAKLTVIPDTPLADRARCAQATGWRDRVSFSELHVGSQLCALSHLDHYASMEVRLLPDSPASNGRFTFYGITWWN